MKKELEALNDLGSRLASVDTSSTIEEDHDDVFPIIRKALTPPTADEVCEALSKEFGHTYYYDEELRDFWCEEFGSDDHMQTWYLSNEPLNELVDYPHLITLIGRFYQSLEGDNNATL